MAAHDAAVTFTGGRYPHRPTCSCGWTTTWGYLTEHAAQCVADDHKEHHMGGLHPCQTCGVELDGDDPHNYCGDCNEAAGWASYAAEQERHAETQALLDEMTREARLSREATERAVRRLRKLSDGVAHLHDIYAAPRNEPRCCSDCAANDISAELRRLLADVQ